MYALIFGYLDGDSYLTEVVLGIYDSEEAVPEKYKRVQKQNFKTRIDTFAKNVGVIYCGKQLDLSDPIIFDDSNSMTARPYYRLQSFEVNQPLKTLMDCEF